MTLKKRFGFDSRLKNAMSGSARRPSGAPPPPAGTPPPFVGVAEFREASARFLKTAGAQTSSGAVEFIARQADPDVNRLSPSEVH